MLLHGKVKENEEKEELMEKSKNDLLSTDGLTTLKYEVVSEKLYPLYTWILAKLPPPPPKKPKTTWDMTKKGIWYGMSLMTSGVAKTIAEKAHDVAFRNEGEREKEIDHVY